MVIFVPKLLLIWDSYEVLETKSKSLNTIQQGTRPDLIFLNFDKLIFCNNVNVKDGILNRKRCP
jgi:hypothetical protein